jgi:hypothetical protein
MYQDFRTECDKLGITIGPVEQNKHAKVCLTNSFGLTRKLIVPVSPSDKRGWLNCRAFLRRFARSQP